MPDGTEIGYMTTAEIESYWLPAAEDVAHLNLDATPEIDRAKAMTACRIYGGLEFPNGFDIKSNLFSNGMKIEERGASVFYAVNVTVTNGFGQQLERRMECLVGGTNSSPEIGGH